MLAIKNSHSRDANITFEEGPHIYTIHGDKSYTSVTTWNHRHFEKFDSSKIVRAMLRGPKMQDPTYKYFGMTQQQILDQWEQNRNEASQAGTKMHYDIECFYNGEQVANDSIEFSYFKKFVEAYSHLKPFRTEWMVYYEELKIAGSIDMVFENEAGDLLIYDWKRCNEIENDKGVYTKYAKTDCIAHLPDTNFWHYALQLNMYKTIIEHKYGKKVVELCLIRLHPNNQYKTFERIEVPFLEKEMADLIDVRKQEVRI